jgi:hypothetical protein
MCKPVPPSYIFRLAGGVAEIWSCAYREAHAESKTRAHITVPQINRSLIPFVGMFFTRAKKITVAVL